MGLHSRWKVYGEQRSCLFHLGTIIYLTLCHRKNRSSIHVYQVKIDYNLITGSNYQYHLMCFLSTFFMCIFRYNFQNRWEHTVYIIMWSDFSFQSVQFSHSVVSNSLWPHGLHSMPGFPVYYQLPELAQTHVHWVGDVIQPSYALSSPSPPAFNFSQHQGLFKWVSSLHQVAKILEFHIHHQSFQWIFRTDFL